MDPGLINLLSGLLHIKLKYPMLTIQTMALSSLILPHGCKVSTTTNSLTRTMPGPTLTMKYSMMSLEVPSHSTSLLVKLKMYSSQPISTLIECMPQAARVTTQMVISQSTQVPRPQPFNQFRCQTSWVMVSLSSLLSQQVPTEFLSLLAGDQ
jgi:hypothetical protein